MPRYWKITANFHAVGEVIKVVQAPNWQGGLRNGALALKADARLKGKKPKAVALTVVETTEATALEFWGTLAAQLGLQGEELMNQAANVAVPAALPEPEG